MGTILSDKKALVVIPIFNSRFVMGCIAVHTSRTSFREDIGSRGFFVHYSDYPGVMEKQNLSVDGNRSSFILFVTSNICGENVVVWHCGYCFDYPFLHICCCYGGGFVFAAFSAISVSYDGNNSYLFRNFMQQIFNR